MESRSTVPDEKGSVSSLAHIALDAAQLHANKNRQAANIIEFIESDWGLGARLYPVQRIILKASYGIPLNKIDKTVEISDWRRTKFLTYTEEDYLKFLFDDGRCNIREVVPGHDRREIVLAIGRRSGKTYICAGIAAYESYRLLLKSSPQNYYGLPSTKEINIISVATDKKQAGILYNLAGGFYNKCAFFAPYKANHTQSFVRFQTPADIQEYGRHAADPKNSLATIEVSFRSCVASGLRGPDYMAIILDELAHFSDGTQSSAESVYTAATPGISALTPKDPNDPTKAMGRSEGRILAISSPLGKEGFFYKLYMDAYRGGDDNMLAFQAPSWEVNPTIPEAEFRKFYVKDANKFYTEFGAEFSDRTRGWIEKESDLMSCVDLSLTPASAAPARKPHFVGIDLALVGDGTAIAIGHIDEEQRIVLDLIDHIKAGEGAYQNVERLDFDEVADWIYQFSRRFFFSGGIFDQWAGIPFEQALAKKGLRQLKKEHMTKPLNSQIYQNFKDMMWDKRVVLFDSPIPQGKNHCPYIDELLHLQAEQQSKHIIIVRAPNVPGQHDDMSDALVRMVWVASQNISQPKYISTGGRGQARAHNQMSVQSDRRARLKAFRKGGSSPDRQPGGSGNQIRGRRR